LRLENLAMLRLNAQV